MGDILEKFSLIGDILEKVSLMGYILEKFGLMRDWYAPFAILSKERRTGSLWHGARTEKMADHVSRITKSRITKSNHENKQVRCSF